MQVRILCTRIYLHFYCIVFVFCFFALYTCVGVFFGYTVLWVLGDMHFNRFFIKLYSKSLSLSYDLILRFDFSAIGKIGVEMQRIDFKT